MPLTLTRKAIEKLSAELERKRSEPDQVFRLTSRASGGFGMRLDAPSPDDVVLPHEGNPLLVVEPVIADDLADAALDAGQASDEPDWVLVRGGTPS